MRGNPFRCRACHRLADKSGWCKKHRPSKRTNPFRENFKPKAEYFKERKNFGVVKDTFGIEDAWD
jgi:hypothetical protein